MEALEEVDGRGARFGLGVVGKDIQMRTGGGVVGMGIGWKAPDCHRIDNYISISKYPLSVITIRKSHKASEKR